MKQLIKITIISIFFLFVLLPVLRAEYVFLKDGSILKCKIESETAASINVRLADGKQMVINPKNVMRVLYTELYMGKIFINKTDGTVIEAYMVDEDQTTYTFRKDLNKPQEFTLKRDEVLFTTRKNPSGLTGTAKSDTIMISWKPPYNPVKEYNIYFKSGNEYKVHGQTTALNYILKGLKSNTLYAIKVTAVDKEGYESLPSNEIKVTTLNIVPKPPAGVRTSVITESGGKTMTAKLTWKAGFDADGSIKAYHIYQKTEKGFVSAGSSSNTEYEVRNLDAGRNYYFTVRSVDDKNDESEDSRLVNTLQLKGYDISIKPCLIFPFGKFKDINKIGYGALISGIKRDILLKGTELGFAFGYWNFSGAENDIEKSYMMPLVLTAGYRFEILYSFYIAPEISMGFSYNSISYKWKSPSYTGTKDKKSKKSMEPIAMAGFSVSYDFADRWTIGAGASYGFIYEKDGSMQFAEASLSVVMRF